MHLSQQRFAAVTLSIPFALTVLMGWQADRAKAADAPPAVGDAAADFELRSLGGDAVSLSKTIADGPVALVVLRGFPGYQCPICSIQVGDLLKNAEEFRQAGARVLLVYPGPSSVDVESKAKEFLHERALPDHFMFLVDPDYKFTNAWHLRWDAPRETAYPSTFVIDGQGKIRYALVSKTHGGRAKAADVLKVLSDAK